LPLCENIHFAVWLWKIELILKILIENNTSRPVLLLDVNIKINLKEIYFSNVDWINMDRDIFLRLCL
jgi:hypothetical protein